MTPAHERRRFARQLIRQPVKVQCQLTGRYLGGQTEDLSAGGVRMWLSCPSLLVPGQRVKIAIDSAQRGLLQAADMVDATVVRSLGDGTGQHLAVHFDHTLAMAKSA
jgi:c-di-GMP-binding flagellar brake protein YcgR